MVGSSAPAPSRALRSFLDALEASRILPSEQYRLTQSAVQWGVNTDHQLAEWLVEREWLTRWQADHLLKGEKHFYLGEYLLLDHIASGGMGAVYKARKWGTSNLVAMKLLSQQATDDPVQRERFRREITFLSRLDHPTIVKAYHAETAGDLVYLVMEYVAGQDLWEWQQQYVQLPQDFACECIRQACVGLDYAAQFGLVHRDIKPANLMVSWPSDGGPLLCKVLDLGLARLREAADGVKPLTTSGQFVGTPDYISPEQCRDPRQVDVRTDIYSLGVTLFELLSGSLPFRAATPIDALLQREFAEAPPLRSRLPTAPAELEAVVAKMLARDPNDRYSTPREVADALDPFCGYMRNPAI